MIKPTKTPIPPIELGKWLTEKARSAAGYRNVILRKSDRSSGGIEVGKMFFFYYDPKHKATLPIYDRFPLTMPIEYYNDGFLGLNIHYLSQPARMELFEKLLKFKNNNFMDERTKINASYDLLSKARLSNVAQPAIKRYLSTQVRSHFVEIQPNEWDKAAALPVAMFVRKK